MQNAVFCKKEVEWKKREADLRLQLHNLTEACMIDVYFTFQFFCVPTLFLAFYDEILLILTSCNILSPGIILAVVSCVTVMISNF